MHDQFSTISFLLSRLIPGNIIGCLFAGNLMTLYGSGYEFFFFYFFLTVIPEDISGTFLHAYFPAVRTVFDAFSVVNLNDIFLQADCLSRTDLDANLTRDAPCFAYPLYLLSGILGLAGGPNSAFRGMRSIIPFVQVRTQVPQPTQRFVSTTGKLSIMVMALKGQASAQSPKPTHA